MISSGICPQSRGEQELLQPLGRGLAGFVPPAEQTSPSSTFQPPGAPRSGNGEGVLPCEGWNGIPRAAAAAPGSLQAPRARLEQPGMVEGVARDLRSFQARFALAAPLLSLQLLSPSPPLSLSQLKDKITALPPSCLSSVSPPAQAGAAATWILYK